MGDIISIVDFIIAHKDNIVAAIFCVAMILSLTIAFYSVKEKLLYYITHRRNRYFFVMLIISAVIEWMIQYYYGLPFVLILLFLMLWVLLLVICIVSFRPRSRYHSLLLRKYKKYLDDGAAIEHMDFFKRKSHLFLFDIDDKIEYKILRSAYYMETYDYETSYETLMSIEDKFLYTEELVDVKYYRAIVLAMMGNMQGANQLLGPPADNKRTDPFIWVVYSYISEQGGRIKEAYEYIQKAKAIIETGKVNNNQKAQVISDYARIALMRGNDEEARRYYAIAYENAKSCKDTRIFIPITTNYIIRTAFDKSRKDEALKLLIDFKNRIKNESISNMMEYENCALVVYRQFGCDSDEYNIIKDSFSDTYDKLMTPDQKESFKASTFRMLMNGNYDTSWFDNYVSEKVDTYTSLEIMTKLVVFKEYIGIMQQDKFRVLKQRKPYNTLYKIIMDYYHKSGICEIEQEEKNTGSYNILKYKALTEHKLFIYKLLQRDKHIELSTKLYMNHYNTLLSAGLRIEALYALMLYIDECASPDNILIMMPHWSNPILYSVFIENAAPPPSPYIDIDGIHLKYYLLSPNKGFTIIPLKKGVISEKIEIAINEWHQISEHPAKVDIGIHIAHFLMALEKKNEAREFYMYYKNSGVGKNQLADWMRDDIAELDSVFSDDL